MYTYRRHFDMGKVSQTATINRQGAFGPYLGIIADPDASIATPPDLMDDELPLELRSLVNLVQTVWEPCVTDWPELKAHSRQRG